MGTSAAPGAVTTVQRVLQGPMKFKQAFVLHVGDILSVSKNTKLLFQIKQNEVPSRPEICNGVLFHNAAGTGETSIHAQVTRGGEKTRQ